MLVDLELWGSSMIGEFVLMFSLILVFFVVLFVICGREKDYISIIIIDFELKLKYYKYLMCIK